MCYRFNFFPFRGSSFILLSCPRLQQVESCTDVSQRTFKNVERRKKDVHQNILPCPPAWKTRPRVPVSIRAGASTAHEPPRGAGEDLWSWLIFHGNVLLCLWVKYQSINVEQNDDELNWGDRLVADWWLDLLGKNHATGFFSPGCVSCEHTTKLLRCWGRVVLAELTWSSMKFRLLSHCEQRGAILISLQIRSDSGQRMRWSPLQLQVCIHTLAWQAHVEDVKEAESSAVRPLCVRSSSYCGCSGRQEWWECDEASVKQIPSNISGGQEPLRCDLSVKLIF